MAVGGWPGNLGLAVGDALANNRDYVRNIVDVDIDIGGSSRDPLRVLRLLTALARSVATEVTISTLARDEASLSRDAVRDYLDTLSRIFVVDDQPAWSTHLRSSATLRKEPKRHLGDPSLSVALLGADPASLRQDLGFAGQLFESAVVHDLRVFAETLQARVFHARDSSGREVDAIVQTPDGRWSAFEVKLGSAPDVIDRAAVALRRFAQDVTASDGHEAPLTVIVGRGPSYRRPDGVNVVAMSSLGA
jgi:predicted AAA+ superfamily ATPase